MKKVMPEGFRYKSSWEEFESVVDFLKQGIRNETVRILYGTYQSICIEIDDASLEELPLEESAFDKIVEEEIQGLLEDGVAGSFELDSLKEYLESHYGQKNQKESIDWIVDLTERKYRYVVSVLLNIDEINRYYFKKMAVNDKLADFQYNINKFVLDKDCDVKYALMKISTSDRVMDRRVSDNYTRLLSDREKNVEFICDEKDIDHLIAMLEKIKEELS